MLHLVKILFDYVAICMLAFVVYVAAKFIYNILLHPLRHYPGPKLWAVTRLTWAHSMQSGHLHGDMHTLHQRYGPVVRIAPNELSYIDAQAWKDIYMPRHGHQVIPKNNAWTKQPSDAPQSVMSLDEVAHTRNRRALIGAFTEHAVADHASVLEDFVGLMITQFKSRVEQGRGCAIINIVDWLNFLTFDISGYLSYGESFDCLKNGVAHPWVEISCNFGKGLALMASVNFFSPLDKILSFTLPKKVLDKMKYHQEIAKAKLHQRLTMPERSKTVDYVGSIQAYNEQKGEVKVSLEELELNMTVLIFAGAETTSSAMSSIINCLLRNRDALLKVQEEVRNAFESENEITVANTHHLEYLTAVIQEGIRLGPPAAISLPRVMPKGGDTICGQWVPGGTFVAVNNYPAFRSSYNFTHPDSFIPERFLPSSPFPGDNLDVFEPFLVGRHKCLGQKLAWAEMRLTLSRLFYVFDISPVEEVKDFGEQETYMLWQKEPLKLNMRLRKK